jgi:hypothetical protein
MRAAVRESTLADRGYDRPEVLGNVWEDPDLVLPLSPSTLADRTRRDRR